MAAHQPHGLQPAIMPPPWKPLQLSHILFSLSSTFTVLILPVNCACLQTPAAKQRFRSTKSIDIRLIEMMVIDWARCLSSCGGYGSSKYRVRGARLAEAVSSLGSHEGLAAAADVRQRSSGPTAFSWRAFSSAPYGGASGTTRSGKHGEHEIGARGRARREYSSCKTFVRPNRASEPARQDFTSLFSHSCGRSGSGLPLRPRKTVSSIISTASSRYDGYPIWA